jgi:hypothetical protein
MACVLGEIARTMVENRRATRTRIRLSLGAQLALRTLASLLHPTYLSYYPRKTVLGASIRRFRALPNKNVRSDRHLCMIVFDGSLTS